MDFEVYGMPYFATIFLTDNMKYELRLEKDDIELMHHKRMKTVDELVDLFQYFVLNLRSN
jgi:hypothetical protein